MREEVIDDSGLTDLLRFAIIFLSATDEIVSRLGYRIILQYSRLTHDYRPLYEVARSRDLVPIVAAIERINPELAQTDSLASALFSAHSTNFRTVEPDGRVIARTRGQMELRAFNAREKEAVVVAPTSYGKSEMLIEKVARTLNSRTCVVVPTRALIAQTKGMIIANETIRGSRTRVLTHPDAYRGESQFLAVMTQERLQRLLVENPSLVIDQLLVDEAHNLLSDDSRSVDLSQVILTARARNPALAVTYYTPFISAPHSVRHVNNMDERLRSKSLNEHVKAERIVIAVPGREMHLYDQFLDRLIPLEDPVPRDEIDALVALSSVKTLVYLNRPRDAQELARRLAQKLGPIELSAPELRAVRAIADLIDPSYDLIAAIQAGVMFHHGQIPDVLRQYVEELYRSAAGQRILVTTSTLLEGVNTPAESLVVMSPGRGRKNLSRSAFRNLIGRVGRFQEIFDPMRESLDLLQPTIYMLPSSYARDNWNVERFLSSVASLAKPIVDEVANPLLECAGDSQERREALEYLENVQRGASHLPNARVASTRVGHLCFINGVRDFDIFEFEQLMQDRVDASEGRVLRDVSDLVDAIVEIFLRDVSLQNSEDLARVRDNERASAFYKMFIGWRTRNEPFRQLISHFVRYWTRLGDELVFVGSRWGELPSEQGGFRNSYVRMREKTRPEMINLAVVKIKEEQDFVDVRLLKYVEILNELGMVEPALYFRVKYGTDDPRMICLLRNGFSPDLAREVLDGYSDLLGIDVESASVTVSPGLPMAMRAEDVNDILVYECETLVSNEASPRQP